MVEYLDKIPAAKAVSLHDIYRVVTGHSYYHGDRILAALTCIAEGKEVNPVCPADVALVAHGRWEIGNPICPICGEDKFKDLDADIWCDWLPAYCPNCGAKMDGSDGDAKSV